MDTYFWEDLIQFIEEGKVIPIIGPELLQVEVGGVTVPLHQHLAMELAQSLSIHAEKLPKNPAFHDVAMAYLHQPNSRRETLYRRMRSVMDNNSTIPIPSALKKLVSIRAFKLFVTATVDNLVERAINESRFAGAKKCGTCVYSINGTVDLPTQTAAMDHPTVFYLLGRISASPNYALTEEDTLEFIHSLQSDHQPELLFDELKDKHLLLLGHSYQNWLTRFFIRALHDGRLILPYDREIIVVGDSITQDTDLAHFLKSRFSYSTKIYEDGGVLEFIDTLYAHWQERHADDGPVVTPFGPSQTTPEFVPGAVFLSYASEDYETVRRFKESLEEAGLDVWFDRHNLKAGDNIDLIISRNIRRCAVFMPFVSRHAEKRREGFFRREWQYALERSRDIDDAIPFILPVTLDDTPSDSVAIPDAFRNILWARPNDGRCPAELQARLTDLVRAYRRRNPI